MSARPEFEQLVSSSLDLKWHTNPVDATAAGLSQYDHLLGRFTTDDVRQHAVAFKAMANALEACQTDSLDDEIDRTALLNDVRMIVHRFEREKPHVHNPGFWAAHALDGLYLLLALTDRSPEQRTRAATERLRAFPDFFDQARATLENCPRVFLETAADVATAGVSLIDRVEEELSGDETFRTDCAKGRDALLSFSDYLTDELLDGAGDNFGIGEDAFNYHLHFEHALQATARELWRYGHSLIAEVEKDIADLTNEIDASVQWPDLVERLRDDHPPAEQLVPAYAAEMQRSRHFVEDHDLVSVPTGTLDVVETPVFLRPLIPFAAYQPPGVFSPQKTGWFYVTPPGDEADADRLLRDHCVYELACTALHEGYPGHHLQFLNAQQQSRHVRKVVGTPITIEGWALYCEEMMGEQGFYRTLEERLFQRIALLWRAVRVVVDVGLHTRGMSYDEAVDLLVTRVHFDRQNAKAEVRRYCAEPVYQLCYAVGRRELLALREDFQKAAGDSYSLKGFHTAILRYGGLPVSLMRWGMGLND